MTLVYENGDFFVKKTAKGYEVYKAGVTAAQRVACIGKGPAPNLGLARAIAEADKRAVKVTTFVSEERA